MDINTYNVVKSFDGRCDKNLFSIARASSRINEHTKHPHLDPVRALIVDAAPAHDLREVVEDRPGGAGHLTEVACLLPVHGGHVELSFL